MSESGGIDRDQALAMVPLVELIAAVEAVSVAHGLGKALDLAAPGLAIDAEAIDALRVAAAAAVASKFMAVGTPRSIGFVGCGLRARLLLDAHRVVFAPRELRCADPDGAAAASFAAAVGGRVTSIEEACACDIVCTTLAGGGPVVRRAWIRRGTHINAMDGAGAALDADVLEGAKIVVDELGAWRADQVWATLGQVAAGIKDGRELDEITVFDSAGLSAHSRAIARMLASASERMQRR